MLKTYWRAPDGRVWHFRECKKMELTPKTIEQGKEIQRLYITGKSTNSNVPFCFSSLFVYGVPQTLSSAEALLAIEQWNTWRKVYANRPPHPLWVDAQNLGCQCKHASHDLDCPILTHPDLPFCEEGVWQTASGRKIRLDAIDHIEIGSADPANGYATVLLFATSETEQRESIILKYYEVEDLNQHLKRFKEDNAKSSMVLDPPASTWVYSGLANEESVLDFSLITGMGFQMDDGYAVVYPSHQVIRLSKDSLSSLRNAYKKWTTWSQIKAENQLGEFDQEEMTTELLGESDPPTPHQSQERDPLPLLTDALAKLVDELAKQNATARETNELLFDALESSRLISTMMAEDAKESKESSEEEEYAPAPFADLLYTTKGIPNFPNRVERQAFAAGAIRLTTWLMENHPYKQNNIQGNFLGEFLRLFYEPIAMTNCSICGLPIPIERTVSSAQGPLGCDCCQHLR